MDPILSQLNQGHILTPYFSNTHFNIILPSKANATKYSLTFRFPAKISYAFLIIPIKVLRLPSISPS